MRALLVLLALLALLGACAPLGASTRIPPPLVDYRFTEGQGSSVAPTRILDYAQPSRLGDLVASQTTVRWSAQRQGAEFFSLGGGARAVSERDSSRLLRSIETGFSLRIRLTLSVDVGAESVLVGGLGGFVPGAVYTPCNPSNPADGGLRIYQVAANTVFSFVLEGPGGRASAICGTVGFYSGIGTNIPFVVTVTASKLALYSTSGTAALTLSGYTLNATRWNPHPLYLATPSASSAFRGFIREFALYNETLSATDAQALVESAPPNSAPYVNDVSFSPTGTIFAQAYEDVRTNLTLDCADFDGDTTRAILTRYMILRGVFFVNGAQVSDAQFPLEIALTALSYQSNPDTAYSALMYFSCVDARGAIGREGLLSIHGVPVNDAPVPVSRTVSVARRA
jgi:hypothetical protein